MKTKQILFTEPNVAQLVEAELPDETAQGEVLVKTEFTAIRPGTERANLIGERNDGSVKAEQSETRFPRALGYSGVGVVESVGADVEKVRPGDRVVVFWGGHRQRSLVNQANVHMIKLGHLHPRGLWFRR